MRGRSASPEKRKVGGSIPPLPALQIQLLIVTVTRVQPLSGPAARVLLQSGDAELRVAASQTRILLTPR